MSVDTSILGYFLNAGLVVKFVMFMLLMASVVSWTLIFQRSILLKQTRKASRSLKIVFGQGGDLSRLYNDLTSRIQDVGGLKMIFNQGLKNFLD